MTRISITALAVAAAVCGATAAFAAAAPLCVWADDQKVSVVVHYQDAELRTPAGAAKLAHRIRSAAFKVCGGADDPIILTSSDYQRCERQAVDRSVATLGAPLVADALGRPFATALAGR
jgi:UrcA family protein